MRCATTYVSDHPGFRARWYAADVPITPPPTTTQRAVAGSFVTAALYAIVLPDYRKFVDSSDIQNNLIFRRKSVIFKCFRLPVVFIFSRSVTRFKFNIGRMMMKFLAVACFVAAAQGAKIRNEGRVVRSHP